MMTDHWPLFGLRIVTPRLELRVPAPEDLAALADIAAAGVHDPAVQPFTVPWTDAEPDAVARSVLQYHWRTWGTWQADHWTLALVVLAGGMVVGTQDVGARNFRRLREVGTGSWLGTAHQGQGYGTEMRAAVLHLAFAGLGAEYAVSAAFLDNPASLAVSAKLGYVEDGTERMVVRDRAAQARRVRLDRTGWTAARTVPVEIHGLEPCRPWFGLEPAAG